MKKIISGTIAVLLLLFTGCAAGTESSAPSSSAPSTSSSTQSAPPSSFSVPAPKVPDPPQEGGSPLDKILSTYYRRPDRPVEVPDPEFSSFFGPGARIDEDKLIPTFWTDTEGRDGLTELCRKIKREGHIHDLLREENWYAIVTDADGAEIGYAMMDKADFTVGEYGTLGDSHERRYFRSHDAVEKLIAEGKLDAGRTTMTYCVIREFSLGTLLCDGEKEYFIPSVESVGSMGLVEVGKIYPVSDIVEIIESNLDAIFPKNQVDEYGNPYIGVTSTATAFPFLAPV